MFSEARAASPSSSDSSRADCVGEGKRVCVVSWVLVVATRKKKKTDPIARWIKSYRITILQQLVKWVKSSHACTFCTSEVAFPCPSAAQASFSREDKSASISAKMSV